MVARRLIPVLLTSLLAILTVTPAAAAPPDKSMTRTTSLFLDAFSPEAGVNVFLFRDPQAGYVLCVGTPEGSGCAQLAADAVQVDTEDLTSATVAPTTIQLQQCDASGCVPGDEVTVAVTFTGTGDLTRFRHRSKVTNGCTYMNASKGIQRQGEVTLTIDGDAYDAVGFLTTAQDTFKVRCRR